MKPYKKAYFFDKERVLQRAEISMSDVYLEINTYDEFDNETGYTHVFFHPDKRFYLETIYCFDAHRGKGIATFINDLTNYLLNDYDGYVIRGCYIPGQLSTDRINNIERPAEELDLRARKFYNKNGYEIVEPDEYRNNPEKYPYLKEEDFYLGEGEARTIVAKPIIKTSKTFVESNGSLIYIKKNKKTNESNVPIKDGNGKYAKVIIGSGENAITTYRIRGEKYVLADGTIAVAGSSHKKAKIRIEDRLDDILFGKSSALVKKLTRKNRNNE
jgi:GNAT superfamily N-acetyltransferase